MLNDTASVNGNIFYIGEIERDMLYKKEKGRTMHFSLLDPEEKYKLSFKEILINLDSWEDDVLLLGGSTGVNREKRDEILNIKEKYGLSIPIVSFPNSIADLSGRIEAVLYMKCANSRKLKYLEDEIFEGSAYFLKKQQQQETPIQAIPVDYIIVEPGGTVGQITDAQLLKKTDFKRAMMYAKAAELRGVRWLYYEAGSGVEEAIHENKGLELIYHVRACTPIGLIVGGGIRTVEDIKQIKSVEVRGRKVDGIVTGNVYNDILKTKDMSLMKKIIEVVHE